MKQSIQKWTKLGKICGRAPLKNLKRYGLLKFFKGCLPQILIGSFMNTLSQDVPSSLFGGVFRTQSNI